MMSASRIAYTLHVLQKQLAAAAAAASGEIFGHNQPKS